MSYDSFLKLFLNHLEIYLKELKHALPKELYEPEAYILSLGGKRLRPLLSLIACDLFDKNPKQALHSALAVELFHNFSLVHDDILDKAELRRNKKTVHLKWNTNVAILAGDVMLVKSFKVLQNYSGNEYKNLTSVLTKTAILVCEGQQLDMNFETQKKVSVNDYLNMIRLKTAVLLACSLKMGAINAGANKGNQENLYQFGEHLGIAFQLLDDYLDVYAENENKFGKKIGGDILLNKKTFLLLKAYELAQPKQKKTLDSLLNSKNIKPSKKITEIKNIFNELGLNALCKKEADKHTNKALSHLKRIKANEQKKEALKNFSLQLLNREI